MKKIILLSTLFVNAVAVAATSDEYVTKLAVNSFKTDYYAGIHILHKDLISKDGNEYLLQVKKRIIENLLTYIWDNFKLTPRQESYFKHVLSDGCMANYIYLCMNIIACDMQSPFASLKESSFYISIIKQVGNNLEEVDHKIQEALLYIDQHADSLDNVNLQKHFLQFILNMLKKIYLIKNDEASLAIDRFCNALFTHNVDALSGFGTVLKINGLEMGIEIDRLAILALIRSLPSRGLVDYLSDRFRRNVDLSFDFINSVLSHIFIGQEVCPCCSSSLAIGSTEEEINNVISVLVQLFNIFTSDKDIASKLKEAQPFIKGDIMATFKKEINSISKPKNKEQQEKNIHSLSGKILIMIFINEMKLNYLKNKEKFKAINMATQLMFEHVVAALKEYKTEQEKARLEKKAAKRARQKERKKQEIVSIMNEASQPSTSADANVLNKQSSESDDDIIVLEMDAVENKTKEELIDQELKNLAGQLMDKFTRFGNSNYRELAQRCEELVKTSDEQEKEKFRIYIRTNFVIDPEAVE